MISRRAWLRLAVVGAASGLASRRLLALDHAVAPTEMTVYKSPTCGCCAKWVDHVRAAGFKLTVKDVENVDAIKDDLGVPTALRSCHVALVGGYLVEGHVPVDLVQKMLREKPKLAGLAVPGMPAGSPGMEMGSRKDAYDVVAFDRTGKTSVYAKR